MKHAKIAPANPERSRYWYFLNHSIFLLPYFTRLTVFLRGGFGLYSFTEIYSFTRWFIPKNCFNPSAISSLIIWVRLIMLSDGSICPSTWTKHLFLRQFTLIVGSFIKLWLATTLQLKVLEHPRKYILKDKILKRNFDSNQLNEVLSHWI